MTTGACPCLRKLHCPLASAGRRSLIAVLAPLSPQVPRPAAQHGQGGALALHLVRGLTRRLYARRLDAKSAEALAAIDGIAAFFQETVN